jgi:hypothetical protein
MAAVITFNRSLFPSVLAVALLPACKSPGVPEATSASAAPGDDIGAAKYAVCTGQGANAKQLAPAFLDEMPACEAADAASAHKLVELGGEGKLNDNGDCEFEKGVSCHFHTSMEFVRTGKLKDDERAVGEIHCIVPGAQPKSPTVYGAHLRCKAGTSPEQGAKACSSELLRAVDGSQCLAGFRCCDNGTLTKPVGEQSEAEQKLRPDFRICQDDAIEIDCSLFRGMHGHTANVAGLGEAIHGNFNAGGDSAHH